MENKLRVLEMDFYKFSNLFSNAYSAFQMLPTRRMPNINKNGES